MCLNLIGKPNVPNLSKIQLKVFTLIPFKEMAEFQGIDHLGQNY